MNNENIVNKVGKTTIVWNIILSAIKFITGIIGSSSAMVSDAIHSLSDVVSTIVAMIGVKIASKEKDDSHQYGHEKYECIASLLLAFIMFITGVGITVGSIDEFIAGVNNKPSYITLVAALLSILVKELMYRYTIYYGNKINSIALKADAHHHRSDALSSIGAAIGIVLSRVGFVYGDIIASILISIIICIEAVHIFNESVDKLVDKACDEAVVANAKNIINNVDGVICIDRLMTRQFGSMIFIDVDIAVNKKLSLEHAHNIAENVHNEIENRIIECKHIMVHVNPYTEKEDKQ